MKDGVRKITGNSTSSRIDHDALQNSLAKSDAQSSDLVTLRKRFTKSLLNPDNSIEWMDSRSRPGWDDERRVTE